MDKLNRTGVYVSSTLIINIYITLIKKQKVTLITQFIMNITKSSEMTSGISKFEEVISRFEEQLKKNDKDESYYHLVIVGEYNREVCDEVQKLYMEAGWEKVSCRTSRENGERGGLTGLKLWKSC